MAAIEKKDIKFDQPGEALTKANHWLWLIILLVVTIVLTAGYVWVLSPGLKAISGERTATAESEFVKAKHEELLRRIKELKSEYNSIKTSRQDILDRLKAAIPDEPQTAELFVLADHLAEQHGFILDKMEIVGGSKKATVSAQVIEGLPAAISSKIGVPSAPASSGSAGMALATSSLPLNSLIVHLSFIRDVPDEAQGVALENREPLPSPYGAFKSYLTDLETNLRLLDIQSVAFGEFVADEPINFNVDIVTYYKK